MKKIITGVFFLFCYCAYSQDIKPSRWYSTASIDFSVPYEMDDLYGRYISKNNGYSGGAKLGNYGMAVGALYTINYLLFKRMSLGAVTGFQYEINPYYTIYKLGGKITYFLVDSRNDLYIYMQDSNNFSLNRSQFKNGNNFRLGIGYPIAKLKNIDIDLEAFFEQNDFKERSRSLLRDEISDELTAHSYGVSLGIKF